MNPKFVAWICWTLVLLVGCSPQLARPVPESVSDRDQVAISGSVYRDLNGNGLREPREQGEPGIQVSAYDAGNRLVATTATDWEGNYVLPPDQSESKLARDEIYRVEFSGWVDPLRPGPRGTESGTEIQFVLGGAHDVHLGLFSPDQYSVRKEPAATAQPGAGPSLEDLPPAQPPAPPGAPGSAAAQEYDGPYAGSSPAPDFPVGLAWLNTGRPLTYDDLRGKVVLLDFWTFGCIACIEMLPELERLQDSYPTELVVVGVHAAKFPYQGQTDSIRKFVQRYNIDFPVVNDQNYQLAGAYRADIWPTLVLVNPVGRYVGARAGRGAHSQVERSIAEMVETFDRSGLIDRTPLDLKSEADALLDTPLRFPSEVLADEIHHRLFIADTGHHRIIVTDLTGKLMAVIGNGKPGLQDGDYGTASFRQPQGLALAGSERLYVSDTENHAIRSVDLARQTVETVAGVGRQGYMGADTSFALTTALNYPGDIVYKDGHLYVTMMGQHQIWILDPERLELRIFAGSGQEALTDGPLLRAAFDQPSALAASDEALYVADSEASAIRRVDLGPVARVQTLAGQGFTVFGDQDGTGHTARLQRPGGLAYHGGLLYIADSYNNKIKILDPGTGDLRTLFGAGPGGWRDGREPLFALPSGLDAAGDRLYVADANNHVVRVLHLDTKTVSTLVLADEQGLLAGGESGQPARRRTVTLEAQSVSAGSGTLILDITFPAGFKLNDQAPCLFRWYGAEDIVRPRTGQAERIEANPSIPLEFPVEFREGSGKLSGDAVIYYCRAGAEPLCLVEEVSFLVPIRVSRGANADQILMKHVIGGR